MNRNIVTDFTMNGDDPSKEAYIEWHRNNIRIQREILSEHSEVVDEEILSLDKSVSYKTMIHNTTFQVQELSANNEVQSSLSTMSRGIEFVNSIRNPYFLIYSFLVDLLSCAYCEPVQ
jgi:hypothetical protein